MGVRLYIKQKPNNYTESCMIDVADRWSERNVWYCKRVKANKGAPGVDGMTIDETLIYLREHNHELVDRIGAGHYTPSPVRRVGIPKPDGGVRKLGIASMKNNLDEINSWLYHRIRMCIWKQWNCRGRRNET